MDVSEELLMWRARAQDLILENDHLRIALDILRDDLNQEISKHA